jgi:hypothetical protein
MKIQMIVHMKNDDGILGAESTIIEVDVPNYEAFTGPEQFGEVFDQYERKVLETRKEVTEAIQILQDLSQEKMKNTKELNNLINYLDRNRSYLLCYALRDRLSVDSPYHH